MLVAGAGFQRETPPSLEWLIQGSQRLHQSPSSLFGDVRGELAGLRALEWVAGLEEVVVVGTGAMTGRSPLGETSGVWGEGWGSQMGRGQQAEGRGVQG